MSDNALARMDEGEANRRILSKLERRADFRRVEAASLKRMTQLQSHEAKTAFVRGFMSLQESMYVISEIGRTKLPDEIVEQIEDAFLAKMEEVNGELNQAFDGAELLLKNNGIETVATYETKPLEFEVTIISAEGSDYLEMILKLDRLMPVLATLDIKRVVKKREIAHKKARLKRIVGGLASMARNLKLGVRRRMNEVDAKARAEEEAKGKAVAAPQSIGEATSESSVEPAAIVEPSALAEGSEMTETAESEPKPRRSRQKADTDTAASAPEAQPQGTAEPAVREPA